MVVALQGLLRRGEERATWRQEHERHQAHDDSPVEVLVGGKIGEDGVRATAREGELHRPTSESLFERIEIEIEQWARVADDDERIGPHLATLLCPEIGGVVQGGRVAPGSATYLPAQRCRGREQRYGNQDAAPRQRGDDAFKTGSR